MNQCPRCDNEIDPEQEFCPSCCDEHEYVRHDDDGLTLCIHCGKTCPDTPEPLSDGERIELENLLIAMRPPVDLVCEYRNWRGEVAVRRFRPIRLWHGSTEWHREPCLLLKAMDLDKNAERDFCMTDFNLETLQRA